jgi:hypothetical protein
LYPFAQQKTRLNNITSDDSKRFFKNIFGPKPLLHFFYTQTMHIKPIKFNSYDISPYKPYTLAGFEPGSSVPEADAMSSTSKF